MKRFLAIQKFRVSRGYGYFTTFGIPFLVSAELQRLLAPYMWFPIWLALPIAGLLVYALGLVDDLMGFLGQEQKYTYERNPAIDEILTEIRKNKK